MRNPKHWVLLFIVMATMGASVETSAQSRAAVRREVKVKKIRHRKRAVRKHHRVAHYRYRHLPPRGYRSATAPAGATTIVFRRSTYAFISGVYYKALPAGGYVVVPAPKGIRIRVLPIGFRQVNPTHRTLPIYYYYGTYYQEVVYELDNNEFEVIEPVIGAQVDALPKGYKEIKIDGDVFYVLDDNYYYREVVTGEGDEDVFYELISIASEG